MRMSMWCVAVSAVAVLGGGVGAFPQGRGTAPGPGAVPAFAYAEPGISPDGREIAFTSGGDIWTVPADGSGAPRVYVKHADSPAVVR